MECTRGVSCRPTMLRRRCIARHKSSWRQRSRNKATTNSSWCRCDAGTWAGSEELLARCFHSAPSDIRELRVRADAGFGYGPVLEILEARLAQYAVVARMIPSLKHALKGLRYEQMNPRWEIAEFEHHPHDWSQARRCIVARRRIEETDPEPTLFTLERYAFRGWHTNLPLTPAGVCHFYDTSFFVINHVRVIGWNGGAGEGRPSDVDREWQNIVHRPRCVRPNSSGCATNRPLWLHGHPWSGWNARRSGLHSRGSHSDRHGEWRLISRPARSNWNSRVWQTSRSRFNQRRSLKTH